MEVITSLEVRTRLAAALPGTPSIWLPDTQYLVPTRAEVETLIYRTYFDQYAYKRGIRDCDKFALLLHAFVVQERARLSGKYAWAFGEAWYRLADNPIKAHALNLAITDKGVLCVEPQNDTFSLPDRDHHRYYFVRL